MVVTFINKQVIKVPRILSLSLLQEDKMNKTGTCTVSIGLMATSRLQMRAEPPPKLVYVSKGNVNVAVCPGRRTVRDAAANSLTGLAGTNSCSV
jgi:hypothetical protein